MKWPRYWSFSFSIIPSKEIPGLISFRMDLLDLLATANGDCSHEIKRCLLLGRKVMTNLGSILKSRDITLPTKVRVDSLEKTLMLGGIGGRRRRGQQRMRWLDGITDSMDVESE